MSCSVLATALLDRYPVCWFSLSCKGLWCVNLDNDGVRSDVSSPQTVEVASLLSWRRQQRMLGGRAVDLDWLLDLGAGLRWSELQRIQLNPEGVVMLSRSLDELSGLWLRHLENEEPLQYLLGLSPWRDVVLEVSPAVLIPRQETELLVDLALQCWPQMPPRSWVDLGTGSGAIAVSLSRAWPEAEGHAVDCSAAALRLADRNLRALAPGHRCQMHQGDWWEPFRPLRETFDLVVSNPPYIPSGLIPSLDGVVRLHEPHLALSGGSDGLHALRSIIQGAIEALAPNGWLMLEHHHDQSAAVIALMGEVGLIHARAEQDLGGIARFAVAQKMSGPAA